MTLPTPLAADLADFDRGAFDEDFERCMEFFGALIQQGAGEIPFRVDRAIQKAITEGYLSSAGDVLLRDYEAPHHWHIEQLLT